MALLAISLPVLPGKSDDLKKFLEEINGERHEEFVASRKMLGIKERSFLQTTPEGDLVIVTVEGDDPAGAFARFGEAEDDFTDWFIDQVKNIHGIDLRNPPEGPLPKLIAES